METKFRGIPIIIDENGLHLGDFKDFGELKELVGESNEIKMDEYAHDYFLYVLCRPLEIE